jgi:V/A-type H+-transporting ATPase subunit I
MRLPAALGDVLSYLRLFALSYAGLALAGAFNSLAAEMALLPGFGLMLAGALLLLGHGLNLVLGIAGGFVHGLRLNLIEFIAWAGVDEGHAFHPFSLSAPPANRPMSWTRPSFS